MIIDSHPSLEYAAAGVAIDPWDKTPRLEVTHINGQEVSLRAPLRQTYHVLIAS